MATFLKQIETTQKRIVNDTVTSNLFTTAYDSELTFSRILPVTDTNFKTVGLSSVWSLFNFYSEKNYNDFNVNYSEGGLLETTWESILEAYQNHGMIMFQVTEDNWRKFIDGKNIEIQIPLDASYTGSTSGLTATTLYSSFIDETSLKVKSTNSICDPIILDTLYSEPSTKFTNDLGIGFKYLLGTNPVNDSNQYQSGLVFLMSNDYTPHSGSTSKNWAQLYGQANKYTKGAPLVTPSGGLRDVAVGAFFINSGIGFIWAKEFVESFDFTSSVGGTGTTSVYFTGGTAFMNGSDGDSSTKLQVDIILNPNEFNESLNSSYVENAIQNGEDCEVAYNTITLHDSQGRCLVYAKSPEPIIKRENNFSVVTINIPIDGDIQTSLAETRGCLYGSC
jgi:hypothetical protein